MPAARPAAWQEAMGLRRCYELGQGRRLPVGLSLRDVLSRRRRGGGGCVV